MEEKEITELKNEISEKYKNDIYFDNSKIIRGHRICMSSYIENAIATFISKILPEHTIFLDSTIRMNRGRPDLLVINKDNKVVAYIEIKSKMGYCPNAENDLKKMVRYNNEFKSKEKINCMFSEIGYKEVSYGEEVKLFFISLSSDLCNRHELNRKYAENLGINYYTLFSGNYDKLKNKDIDNFYKKIVELKND